MSDEEPKSQEKKLPSGYRAARRNTTILCALAFAWATAQFELKSPQFGMTAFIDISKAHISYIFLPALVYSFFRLVIEYAMLPDEVRRWRIAQTDFNLTFHLVQLAALTLAAAEIARSFETLLLIVTLALIIFIIYWILAGIGIAFIMPSRMRVRERQGRITIASSAIEAGSWSEILVAILMTIAFNAVGMAMLSNESLRSYLGIAPTSTAISVFVVVALLVFYSLFLKSTWSRSLFAQKEWVITTPLPNGNIGVSFAKDNPRYSEPPPKKLAIVVPVSPDNDGSKQA